MALGISAREFARRDGCAHTLVNRAVKCGHLRQLEDGSLDPAQVGTGWREENRRGGNPVSIPVSIPVSTQPAVSTPPMRAEPDETPEAAAERILTATGATMSLAEAERVKECYLALLRQLEYDTKAGAVIAAADVASAVGAEYAQVRTRLLAIPAERAPQIHRLKTVTEIQDALHDMIVEALEELTQDQKTLQSPILM